MVLADYIQCSGCVKGTVGAGHTAFAHWHSRAPGTCKGAEAGAQQCRQQEQFQALFVSTGQQQLSPLGTGCQT